MKHFGWIFLMCISLSVTAQDRLVVSGNPPNLFVFKIMLSPQSLTGLAEQYNVPVATLAKLNDIYGNEMIFKVGEQVKIPLTRDNFIQRNIFGRYQPVFHLVKIGDNMSRISARYKIGNLDTLLRWNNLPDENLPVGKFLVVGFIVNKKAVFSSAGYQAIAYDTIPNPNVYDAAKFGAQVLKGEIKPVSIPVPNPPVQLPAVTVQSPTENKGFTPITGQNQISNYPVNPAGTAGNPGNLTIVSRGNAGMVYPPTGSPFETRKPALVAPTLVQTEGDFSYRPRSNDEGYFAHTYYMRAKDRAYQAITGDASIFKTINGFNDRKFYVLINEIIPGTIVRITAVNKKSICAKVLGPLPETKGAKGLVIRMNNAAAAALGMYDPKFMVSITYVEY